MTRQDLESVERLCVVVQPDEMLALWSTTTRRLVVRDGSEEETIEHLISCYEGQNSSTGSGSNGSGAGSSAAEGPARGPADEDHLRRSRQAARWTISQARQGLQPRGGAPHWKDAVHASISAPLS